MTMLTSQTMIRMYFVPLLLLWLMASSAWAADIQVAVDRNPVRLNESFKITFTAYQEPDGKPDFSPLAENFDILNQQRSSNASWVNGQSSRTEQWILNVMAKQAGELLIPPISFGADSSKALTIKVSDSPQPAQGNDDVFLQVEAAPEKPYVQSQVVYTLKLYRRVQITQASLNEPEVKDALVEKLAEDSTYATQLNGVDYWVTERKYAIFPQQSGVLTIAPLTLTAEVLAAQRPSFNGFFNRQVTETRRVSSKAITLNVLPVPPQFSGSTWLSADDVVLKDNWSDSNLQTKVGEPLTRTITLSAKATTVGQLPELAGQDNIDGLKTYPDQPLLKEDKQSDGLTALREEKIAYIPAKAGDFTLPAIRIDWFNGTTGKMETAQLPAVTIKALAAGGESGTAAPSSAPATTTAEPAAQAPSLPPSEGLVFWQGLSAFLALGWLVTAIAWTRSRRKRRAQTAVAVSARPAGDSAVKRLKAACLTNDPQAATQALLQWGRQNLGIDNLNSLARSTDEPLSGQILELNRLVYSGDSQAWKGAELWQAFNQRQIVTAQAKPGADDVLEPLYRL